MFYHIFLWIRIETDGRGLYQNVDVKGSGHRSIQKVTEIGIYYLASKTRVTTLSILMYLTTF
jgi:hypothetical protein